MEHQSSCNGLCIKASVFDYRVGDGGDRLRSQQGISPSPFRKTATQREERRTQRKQKGERPERTDANESLRDEEARPAASNGGQRGCRGRAEAKRRGWMGKSSPRCVQQTLPAPLFQLSTRHKQQSLLNSRSLTPAVERSPNCAGSKPRRARKGSEELKHS